VLIEKLIGGAEIELAVAKLEQLTGRTATAIMPVEAGGCNSLLPVKLAALRGLPLVDADGMGRAFPELQMATFNVYGIPATPLAIANEHGEFVLIGARDARSAEAMIRPLAVHMGGGAAISCYPMSGAEARRTAVPRTMTLALEIGRAIHRGRRQGDPFDALVSCLRSSPYDRHCRVLFDGKITDVERTTTGGFAIGRCRISSFGGTAEAMEIGFQNENLVARVGGATRAIVPDLITILDRETAEPITTEHLGYGQRVKVLGVSVPPIMRSAEALAVFGPRCFGLDELYRPIEELA
jgi:hypothetical protein